ncbi:hypothetical protein SK37_05387 [Citrobacter sp. MGH109]|uniref:Uncharacterized protein n=1 Tax=Klebsiella oxytoca TaxID=571 RepID=A0A318F5J6_KLEOX|nr:hypothetical protein SK37_05387 [Citrobacter sp. MGH109]PXW34178.1 hypothetical protein DET57_1382 [Klebsiella oxytoca]WOL77173.1 hypothetical protein GFOBKLCA_00032 [Citrobacter freundii]WOL77270.1 hypothetical protein LFMJCKMM_00031 [Escherichia coli]WOL77335.1 hypothetical protein NCPKKNBD_00027 [Enterobacter hormaechei subsp. steigerwaltii]WOL77415.1 hypothetical protein PMOPNHBP_00032 [Klebsiella pneumoniae]WOL77843.1 hypothetical protein OFKJFGJP_00034 [Enterobacter hormaechei subsp.
MGREVAGPASVRRYAILDVKRRGVVPPPLATFPRSSIDKFADQFQDCNHSV